VVGGCIERCYKALSIGRTMSPCQPTEFDGPSFVAVIAQRRLGRRGVGIIPIIREYADDHLRFQRSSVVSSRSHSVSLLFRSVPRYILPRHLHANEVIHPLTSIGSFKGEPVYSRSSLITLKAAENWIRSGRVVKQGEQPMKTVKARVGTVGRMREVNTLKEAGEGAGKAEVMQGLYACRQTEPYKAPPVLDVGCPSSSFGWCSKHVSALRV
jgi:hypothetical protein